MIDVTKPWKKKFFETKKIGDTPGLNARDLLKPSKQNSAEEATKQIEKQYGPAKRNK